MTEQEAYAIAIGKLDADLRYLQNSPTPQDDYDYKEKRRAIKRLKEAIEILEVKMEVHRLQEERRKEINMPLQINDYMPDDFKCPECEHTHLEGYYTSNSVLFYACPNCLRVYLMIDHCHVQGDLLDITSIVDTFVSKQKRIENYLTKGTPM